MFNGKKRKIEAVTKYDLALNQHESARTHAQTATIELLQIRQRAASETINAVEQYLGKLTNPPKELSFSVNNFRTNVNRFDNVINQIQADLNLHSGQAQAVISQNGKTVPVLGAAGAVTGLGITALGPQALIAIATTYGTASTGTAIATLSGAALNSATLAWIGSAAAAVGIGGGGMAAGTTILTLTVPIVGLGILATSLATTGWLMNRKDGKRADEATEKWNTIQAEIASINASQQEIMRLKASTANHVQHCHKNLESLLNSAPSDYAKFSIVQKEQMTILIGKINGLSELLRTEVAL